ncbi:hypothetical protein ACWD5Q_12305 [Streptomyces sp. NPDC002513]
MKRRILGMKLGAVVGGLVAAALAFGAVATVSVTDNPGHKTTQAAPPGHDW